MKTISTMICRYYTRKRDVDTMEKSKVIRAFEKIARKEGISVDEVRQEIQKAIDDAMQSDDPAVQAYWRKIKFKGDKPTPEEVVLYIAKQVKSY